MAAKAAAAAVRHQEGAQAKYAAAVKAEQDAFAAYKAAYEAARQQAAQQGANARRYPPAARLPRECGPPPPSVP